MNAPNISEERAASGAATPRFLRRDFQSAHVVEVGISLQQQFGTRHAAAFLKDNFITLDIATRVLLYPDRRRTYS
jgi:hypothetical protein